MINSLPSRIFWPLGLNKLAECLETELAYSYPSCCRARPQFCIFVPVRLHSGQVVGEGKSLGDSAELGKIGFNFLMLSAEPFDG